MGDPFSYEGWSGHYGLVKLNLEHPEVRRHLLEAVRQWVETYHIDGLRLDAADCVSLDFHRELAAFTRRLKPDFWLVGEIIHGDYRTWANPETLDSVTNYECHKGLFSSLNDRNYFEIAYALNRQFGPQGLLPRLLRCITLWTTTMWTGRGQCAQRPGSALSSLRAAVHDSGCVLPFITAASGG
jgi:glycosidase